MQVFWALLFINAAGHYALFLEGKWSIRTWRGCIGDERIGRKRPRLMLSFPRIGEIHREWK